MEGERTSDSWRKFTLWVVGGVGKVKLFPWKGKMVLSYSKKSSHTKDQLLVKKNNRM